MPAFYRLTILPEGRTEDFAGSCGNYYRLEDGNKIELCRVRIADHSLTSRPSFQS